MWNTGIRTVYNNMGGNGEYNWTDQEDQSHNGQLPNGHNEKFGIVAPWCNNSYEIETKAIAFSLDPGGLQFYVFQDEADSRIYYVSAEFDPSSSLWSRRQWAGEGRSRYVNLAIGDQGGQAVVRANAVG